MGAQQKEGAKLRGGGELLRSPVVPLYLSPIIQFTHRVINKVAIETGFPCIPAIKESDGALIWGGWLFDIGCLLDGGHLFQEIQ